MTLAWKETILQLKIFYRDKQALFWTFLFPLFFLIFFSSVNSRGGWQATTNALVSNLVITTMAASFFGVGLNLTLARERGILRRFRVIPVARWKVIAGMVMARCLILLVTLAVQIVLAIVFFSAQVKGNWILVAATLAVGSLMFSAIGFLISARARTVQSASAISNCLFFPFMFLSGATLPLKFLPGWIQNVALFLPPTYMVDALRTIMLSGKGLTENLPNVGIMMLFLAAVAGLSIRLFRWD